MTEVSVETCFSNVKVLSFTLKYFIIHHLIFSVFDWVKLITWCDSVRTWRKTIDPYCSSGMDSTRPRNFFCKRASMWKMGNWNCITALFNNTRTLKFKLKEPANIWLTDLLTYWLTDLLTYWLTDLLTDWLTHWLTDSLTYWLTDLLTDLLTYSLTDLLTHSLTHSLTYSLTH